MAVDPLNYEANSKLDGNKGVFYRLEDSPGMLVRLGTAAIDLIVWLLLFLAGAFAWQLASGGISELFGWCELLLTWFYLAALKTTRFGTAGYRVFGLRLVTIRGETPSIWRVTLRTFLAFWLNPILDLFWMASDGQRQMIRDRLTGTYMIYAAAKPAGTGPLSYARLSICGLHFIHAQVLAAEEPVQTDGQPRW